MKEQFWVGVSFFVTSNFNIRVYRTNKFSENDDRIQLSESLRIQLLFFQITFSYGQYFRVDKEA